MATGAVRAVLLRLAATDADLLDSLASQMRSGRAGVAAIALRHLSATMRRGQPVYMNEPSQGESLGTLVSLDGAPLVVVGQPDEEGMILVTRPQDALLDNKPLMKVKMGDLSVRIHFQPTKAAQPGRVVMMARDGSGNPIQPLADNALAFSLRLGSRISAGPTLGRPTTNRLQPEPVRLRSFLVTGAQADTVTIASDDGTVEVKGYGLRYAPGGVT